MNENRPAFPSFSRYWLCPPPYFFLFWSLFLAWTHPSWPFPGNNPTSLSSLLLSSLSYLSLNSYFIFVFHLSIWITLDLSSSMIMGLFLSLYLTCLCCDLILDAYSRFFFCGLLLSSVVDAKYLNCKLKELAL